MIDRARTLSAAIIRSVRARLLVPRLPGYQRHFAPLVGGKRVLEIGGPSGLFAADGLMPIYRDAGAVDNVNFSDRTIWEGRIAAGETFRFNPKRPPGWQFIEEASRLSAIADGTYEALVSSHTLEHTANPLGALREWMRVLDDRGALVLILPHRDGTFDHRRPVTTLAHLVADEQNRVGEDDQTHLAEVLELHDLSRDAGAGDRAAFEARCARNVENRGLHHHVFDTRLVVEMLATMGLQILHVEPFEIHHIAVAARVVAGGERADNARFLADDAAFRTTSPFPSDRR